MTCNDCIHIGFARFESSNSGYKPWCLKLACNPKIYPCPDFTSKRQTNGERVRK